MYLAICDDQADELNRLTDLLQQWQKERHTVLRFKSYRSAAALVDEAPREQFSLYLLDIMMPGVSGMTAAREIRGFDDTADIVFLTSSPGFAYESYSVHALDYLLKPIQAEQLFPLLDKLAAREEKSLDSLTLKCGAVLTRLPFSRISFVEVIGKHLYFNMTDGSVHVIYATLSEYQHPLLSRPEFMQIHRSYIVNLLSAAELSSAGIRTFSGKSLPISRRLYPEIQKKYIEMFFSERE